jgi:hypothetical protein
MTTWHRNRVDSPLFVGFAGSLAISSVCIYTQIQGQIYRNAEGLYFGWPLVHPDDAYRFVSNAFLIDMLCMLVISAASGVVVATVARECMHRRQFALRSAFVCTAFLATMCALFRWFRDYDLIYEADFVDDGVLIDVIALRYSAWIMAFIIFGEACIPFATWILVMRSSRS